MIIDYCFSSWFFVLSWLIQISVYLRSFQTGFTRFTQIFFLNQETVFIGVNQCLIKLQKLLSDTELHGFTQIFIFFFSPRLSL